MAHGAMVNNWLNTMNETDPGGLGSNVTFPTRDAGASAQTNGNMSSLGVILMSCIALGVFLLLIMPALLIKFRCWQTMSRQPSATDLASTTALSRHRLSSNNSNIAQRYDLIEHWLNSKRVVAHDEICQMALDLQSRSASMQPRFKYKASSVETTVRMDDDDDDDLATTSHSTSGHECIVCMEPMQVDEIVSWTSSSTSTCTHVLHHQCLKLWLASKTGCPCCRDVMLPMDDDNASSPRAQIMQLLASQKIKARPCFYCVQHGVVHVPPLAANWFVPQRRSLPVSPRQQQQQQNKPTGGDGAELWERARAVPSKKELEALRVVETDVGDDTSPDHGVAILEDGSGSFPSTPVTTSDDVAFAMMESGRQLDTCNTIEN